MTTQVINPARRAVLGLLAELRQIEREEAEDSAWMTAIGIEMAEKAATRNVRKDEVRRMLEESAADLRIPGSEHIDVPGYGRIQFTTRAPYLRIAEPAVFIAWARDHERRDLYRVETTEKVETTFAKSAAEAALKGDGVLLPGVVEEPEQTTMSVRWTK